MLEAGFHNCSLLNKSNLSRGGSTRKKRATERPAGCGPGPKSVTELWVTKILCIIVLFSLQLITAESSYAVLSDNVTGNISLSGVRSRSNGDSRSTVRQEFTGTWFRNITHYLSLRSSFRYYRFSFERSQQDGLWKKETQPTVQLLFNHPAVSISANGRKRVADGTTSTDRLTNETFDVGFRTRSQRFGLISVRYYYDNWSGAPDVAGRNLLSQRLNASIDYHRGSFGSNYRLSHRQTDNRVSKLTTTETQHTLRLNYSSMLQNGRLRLAGDYSFDYRSQTDKLPTSGTVWHVIPTLAGLYGDREAVEIGQLQTRPTLIDGDFTEPAQPVIDIGTGTANQSLGVHLGTPRSISALYIYTNKISDEQLRWQVYLSVDNFTWQPHALNPEIRFDAGVKRYEILFPTVTALYIKAVSSGFNQAGEVLVTEIQAVAEVPSTGEISQHHTAHTLNLTGAYKISDRLSSTADLSYQREPSVGLRGSRENIYQSGSLQFQQSAQITHAIKWQNSFQVTRGEIANLRDHSTMYSLRYQPLPTLDLSWSATDRRSFADGDADSDNQRLMGHVNATPLVGLRLNGEVGYGRGRRHAIDQTTDTWDRRISIDARATRSIEATLAYAHQASTVKETDRRFLRDQYSVGLRLRLTRKISLRGNLDLSRGSSSYLTRELGAGWNLSRAISASFLYRLSDDDNSYRSQRYSVRLNCRLSGRSSIYFSYNDNDYSQAAGRHTRTIQMGLRSGF